MVSPALARAVVLLDGTMLPFTLQVMSLDVTSVCVKLVCGGQC
jgi:hypothetical protein